MKKLFAMVAITSFLAACNSGSQEKTVTTDTVTTTESPLMDAVNTADSASKKMQDSTTKLKDNTKVLDTIKKK